MSKIVEEVKNEEIEEEQQPKARISKTAKNRKKLFDESSDDDKNAKIIKVEEKPRIVKLEDK